MATVWLRIARLLHDYCTTITSPLLSHNKSTAITSQVHCYHINCYRITSLLSHHITSHHITSHHITITSHHITSHHITSHHCYHITSQVAVITSQVHCYHITTPLLSHRNHHCCTDHPQASAQLFNGMVMMTYADCYHLQ